MIRRPVEFKVWHKPTQRMYEISQIDFEQEQICQQLAEDAPIEEWDKVYENPFKFEDCVLLQFTGVLDCEGKKIWEGDVLYWSFLQGEDDDEPGLLSELYNQVVFWSGAFGTSYGSTCDWFTPLSHANSLKRGEYHYQKVVGNIYEHPELAALTPYCPIDLNEKQDGEPSEVSSATA